MIKPKIYVYCINCNAKTIHSWSGIGLGNGTIEENISKILKSHYKKKNWKNTDILIIDEVSMMSVKIFDLLDSTSCSHSWNTLAARKVIANADVGVMVLLHQQETGAMIVERIQGADEPIRINQELRTYGIGSQILLDCGVGKMKLLATPRKMPSMAGFGLEVTGYVEADKNS